jgi:hypothetical protein
MHTHTHTQLYISHAHLTHTLSAIHSLTLTLSPQHSTLAPLSLAPARHPTLSTDPQPRTLHQHRSSPSPSTGVEGEGARNLSLPILHKGPSIIRHQDPSLIRHQDPSIILRVPLTHTPSRSLASLSHPYAIKAPRRPFQTFPPFFFDIPPNIFELEITKSPDFSIFEIARFLFKDPLKLRNRPISSFAKSPDFDLRTYAIKAPRLPLSPRCRRRSTGPQSRRLTTRHGHTTRANAHRRRGRSR